MGNLQQPWDHDLIFTGALSLASKGIRPEIHIIGSGAELSYWKQFCEEHSLSNIHFMGRLSDHRMQIELENAKVLLHPMRDSILNP
jgi:glycosyltransferase involved in cell wall biosynthesis